jgi:uncharacterized membrane protein YhfC
MNVVAVANIIVFVVVFVCSGLVVVYHHTNKEFLVMYVALGLVACLVVPQSVYKVECVREPVYVMAVRRVCSGLEHKWSRPILFGANGPAVWCLVRHWNTVCICRRE